MDTNFPNNIYVWGLNENSLLPHEKNKKSICTPTKVQNMENKKWVRCSSGHFSNIVVSTDGLIYGWGITKFGRLGMDGENNITIPTQIKIDAFVVEVSCGKWHSLLLTQAKEVHATGYNKHGALGIGNQQDQLRFIKITQMSAAKQIAAGDSVSYYLDESGCIYSLGHKDRNGLNQKEHQLTPKVIKIDQQFKYISSGFSHSGAISIQGLLYTWGDGKCFQLGHGDDQNKTLPTLIRQEVISDLVSCSFSRGEKYHHSGAVDNQGNLYTWGSGYKGKLGHSISWSHGEESDQQLPKIVEFFRNQKIKVKQFVAGGIHSAVIDNDYNVWTFGCGSGILINYPFIPQMADWDIKNQKNINIYISNNLKSYIQKQRKHSKKNRKPPDD